MAWQVGSWLSVGPEKPPGCHHVPHARSPACCIAIALYHCLNQVCVMLPGQRQPTPFYQFYFSLPAEEEERMQNLSEEL